MAGSNQLRPNTFQTPNLLVDRLMPLLKNSELRVVIFAARHIYGWPESNAAGRERLSITAFERGHRGSKGCGLGRPAIVDALDDLARFGVMKRDGKPNRKGQLWGLADHQDEIDWEGLEQRAHLQKEKARRQTASASRAPRKPSPVRWTYRSAGTSNEPGDGTFNEPVSGTSNEPGDGTFNEPIETHIETYPSKPIFETNESTTTGVDDSTRETSAATTVVVGESLDWILPEIRKLHLTPEAQQELLALGALQALAIAWAAQGPGARSPGGLAVSMMRAGGPPEEILELAKVAVEIGSTDRAAVDRVLNQRQLQILTSQASTLAAAQEPAKAARDPGPGAPDGLDEKPPGSRLTWQDIWTAEKGQLSLRLNASTYTNWVSGAKAVSYANGVLTIQAPHAMALHHLSQRQRDIEEDVSRLAGVAVQIKVVAAPVIEVARVSV